MLYVFVESDRFTRRIVKLGLEGGLADLQAELRANPRAGVVEPGTCGLRKIRIRDSTRWQGKRFGARVHYVFVPGEESIYLMNVYPKDEQVKLTADEKREICRRLRTWGAE